MRSGVNLTSFRRAAAWVSMSSLGLPLFFGSAGVYRGGGIEAAQVVPISSIIVSGFAVLSAATSGLPRTKATLALFGIALFAFANWTVRVVVAGVSPSPLLLLLYLVPLTGIVWGQHLGRVFEVSELLRPFAVAATLIASVHAVESLVTMGAGAFVSFDRGTHDVLHLFTIYQKLIYYPFVLALALLYLLWYEQKSVGVVLLICGALLDLVIVAAREPFVMIVVGSCAIIATGRRWSSAYRIGAVGVTIVTLLAWNPPSLDQAADIRLIRKFSSMLTADTDIELTGRRLENIRAQADDVRRVAVFGQGFVMGDDARLTPHNQYLEWVLRGGAVFALSCFLLLFASTVVSWRASRRDPQAAYLVAAMATILVASFNINTAMRVPYSSMVVWTFAGIAFGIACRPATVHERRKESCCV